jgi:putative Ca2+/H+ antiporter (TMEM165/GDT1 family)
VLLTTALSSFALVFLAEFGDKSQLVCVLLAARHSPLPVVLGAGAAFALLNLLAVTVGAGIASAVPAPVTAAVVAVMFAAFGLKALLSAADEDDLIQEHAGHTVFFTTFGMILVAEFGDKTQLAVAGLAAASAPLGVYVGATTALLATSALGALGGRLLTQRVSVNTLHRIGGVLFLVFAAWITLRQWLSSPPG